MRPLYLQHGKPLHSPFFVPRSSRGRLVQHPSLRDALLLRLLLAEDVLNGDGDGDGVDGSLQHGEQSSGRYVGDGVGVSTVVVTDAARDAAVASPATSTFVFPELLASDALTAASIVVDSSSSSAIVVIATSALRHG